MHSSPLTMSLTSVLFSRLCASLLMFGFRCLRTALCSYHCHVGSGSPLLSVCLYTQLLRNDKHKGGQRSQLLALFKSPCGRGSTKTRWSLTFSSCVCGIGDLGKQDCWSPKLRIVQGFGVKMRERQLHDTFRKVSRTCFHAFCRLSQRLLNNASSAL